MKYKRRRTKVSKYISRTDNNFKKNQKRRSLKKRSTVAVVLVIVLFTLTRFGVVNRSAVRSVFKENGIFDYPVNYVTDKLSFLNVAGEKITDFCAAVFKNDDNRKISVYAKQEKKDDTNVASSAAAEADSAAMASETAPIFQPINPCAGRISSDFGERVHPLSNEVSFHNGLDIAAAEGSEVRACFDGTIETSEYNESSGNYIIIRHDEQYTSSYAHMSKLLAVKGDTVKIGDVIGLVGSTGAATGPHLHFEIRQSGTPLNPKEVISN